MRVCERVSRGPDTRIAPPGMGNIDGYRLMTIRKEGSEGGAADTMPTERGKPYDTSSECGSMRTSLENMFSMHWDHRIPKEVKEIPTKLRNFFSVCSFFPLILAQEMNRVFMY